MLLRGFLIGFRKCHCVSVNFILLSTIGLCDVHPRVDWLIRLSFMRPHSVIKLPGENVNATQGEDKKFASSCLVQEQIKFIISLRLEQGEN
ncbi:hypothetical protein BC830DRAFT_1133078 [Chytriomyces sp. MP71]|nr:hypothetical protein BC830DRAFT_1133078 [Chytriomyces sp. MP71]